MNKVIAILGGACCGKDTLRNMMLDKHSDVFVSAISTTTRPPRVGEIDGVHYHFIEDKVFDMVEEWGQFAQTRKYTVASGEVWKYGYTYDEIDTKLEKGHILTIIDLEGFMELKALYGDKLIGIYLDLDRDIRVQRYLNRDELTFDIVEECIRRIKDDDERAFLHVENWVDLIIKDCKESSEAMDIILSFLAEEVNNG